MNFVSFGAKYGEVKDFWDVDEFFEGSKKIIFRNWNDSHIS